MKEAWNLADYDVIVSPLITEKSQGTLERSNAYTFLIAPSATKPMVKKAVENIFSVEVVSVNTLNCKGKRKRFKGHWGKRADKKKAIVRIKNGQTIDFGEGK